jgi:hypothetical protein
MLTNGLRPILMGMPCGSIMNIKFQDYINKFADVIVIYEEREGVLWDERGISSP